MDELYAILDLRGLIIHTYNSGVDPDGSKSGYHKIHTPAHTLDGFLQRYLLPLTETFRLNHIIAVLDAGNEARKRLFPGYKEGRQELPEEVREALNLSQDAVKDLLKGLGIPMVHVTGTEADDVIAYISGNLPVGHLIETVDNDLVQLAANPLCQIRIKGVPTEDYYAKDADLHVPPKFVALYKSICGDSSDCYGGVPGVGPKKFKALVDAYGWDGMEQLIEVVSVPRLPLLGEAVAETGDKTLIALQSNFSKWKESWNLACLKPELVDGKFDGKFRRLQWTKRVPSRERLEKLFAEHNCADLIDRVAHLLPQQWILHNDGTEAETLQDFAVMAAESPFIAFDWETTDRLQHEPFRVASKSKGGNYVDMLASTLTGAGFTLGRNMEYTFYAPIDHKDSANWPKEFVTKLLKNIPADKAKVAHNCLPGYVEVLTRKGWLALSAASVEQEIMQWDPKTGQLSWAMPIAKVEQHAERVLTWDTHYHKCSYTPNHRMYFQTRNTPGEWTAAEASVVGERHPNTVYIPTAGVYNPTNPIGLSEVEARLMEAIRADGSITGRGRHVRFSLKKLRKIERLCGFFQTLGIPYSRTNSNGVDRFFTGRHPTIDRILGLLGVDKKYGLWVLDLSLACREAVLSEISYWDGCRQPKAPEAGSLFSTVDSDTVLGIELMAHTSGWRMTGKWKANNRGFSEGIGRPIFVGTVSKKSRAKLLEKPTLELFDDKVYCFSVPTQAFLVRSHGRVHITGNCYFELTLSKNDLGYEIPNLHDTAVMTMFVDEEGERGLKMLSKHWLNYDQIKYNDVIEPGKTMSDYTVEHVAQYGADDPLVTAHLYDMFQLILMLEGTWDFVRSQYLPNVYPLVDAFLAGVTIDEEELKRQWDEDQETFDRCIGRVRELIAANQTPEMIEEGHHRVFEERWEVESAKLVQKLMEKDTPLDELNKLKQAKATELREKVLNLVTYADYTKKLKDYKFTPSEKGISAVLRILGLPDIEKVNQGGMTLYVRENRGKSPKGDEYLRLMGEARQFFPAQLRQGPAYEAFVAKSLEYIREHLGDAAYEYTGTELNLDSPPQMQALLYGTLNLPIRTRQFELSDSREKLGVEEKAAQANEDAIRSALAEDCKTGGDWRREVLTNLLEARKAKTRIKNFYSKYGLWLHPIDGNMHPQFTICGTETHRPTGSSPNMLQVPKRNEGLKVRKLLLPNKNLGHDCMCSIDFASQELRIAAGQSLDPMLMGCYWGKNEEQAVTEYMRSLIGEKQFAEYMKRGTVDVHTLTASGILGWSYEETLAAVKDEDHPKNKQAKSARGAAKAVNFGGIYGIGAPKLSRQLLIPQEEAQQYIDDKASLYAGYEKWRSATTEEAHQKGYVTTLAGCRRHLFNNLTVADRGLRGHAERQATNFKIQSTASDKLAVTLTEVHRRGTFRRHRAVLVSPTYDELQFSCHHSVVADLILEIHEIMTMDIPGLPVPVVAEPSFGLNLADQHELGPFPTKEKIQELVTKLFSPQLEVAA